MTGNLDWLKLFERTRRLRSKSTGDRPQRSPQFELLEGRCVPATIQLVNQAFFGGAADEVGTGIALVNAGATDYVYLSGTTTNNDGDGLVVKYSKPTGSNSVSQDWNVSWPNIANGDAFFGLTATNSSVYAAGASYSQTTDTVGGREAKGITVNFPNNGGSSVWASQTPAAPGAFSYGGIERLANVTTAIEGGQTVLFATGEGQSGFSNGGRFFVTKLDANGSILWTRTDPTAVPESVGLDIATSGGFVYVAGFANDTGSNLPYLKKYDFSGNLIWSRTSITGSFNGITIDAPNGCLYAVGRTAAADQNFLIEKWDLNGNRLWTTNYDHNSTQDILNSVVLTNGTLYAVGSTTGNTAGGTDGVVLELVPATGNLLNTSLWGGAADDSFQDVSANATHLHVAGTTRSFGAGGSNIAYAIYSLDATSPQISAVYMDGSTWTPAFRAAAGNATYGYPAQTGAGQLTALPWSTIDTVYVKFSENVNVATANLGVRGLNVANYTATMTNYDNVNFVAKFTLSAPLNTDRVILDLDGDSATAVTDLAGNKLAGSWSEGVSTFPTTGAAGSDFKYRFVVAVGDADRNGQVRNTDLNLVRRNLFIDIGQAGYNLFTDIEGNGSPRNSDLNTVRGHLFIDPPAGPGPNRPVRNGDHNGRTSNFAAAERFESAMFSGRMETKSTLARTHRPLAIAALDALFDGPF